jgi:hypothetical protein
MPLWTRLARLFGIWLLAIWLGGFTFYSAVVIPVLHDELGSPAVTGQITRRVTVFLNVLGVATVTTLCVATVLERRPGKTHGSGSRFTLGLLALTGVCLVGLICLHGVLDRNLDTSQLEGFYALHRLYLWVSTIQWLANLGLLACWSAPGIGSKSRGYQEKTQVLGGPLDSEFPAQSIQAEEHARPIERLSRLARGIGGRTRD